MRHYAELTEAGVKSKDYHLLSKAMDLLSICEMMCSLKRQLIYTLLLLPILGFTVWKRRFVCDGRSRTSVCTRAITALIIKQINTFNLKQIHEKPDNGASMPRIAVKLHISQTTICTASHSCLESSCNFSTLKASEYLMQSRKTFFFFNRCG